MNSYQRFHPRAQLVYKFIYTLHRHFNMFNNCLKYAYLSFKEMSHNLTRLSKIVNVPSPIIG